MPLEDYDLVLADPPYSIEDAERYQTTMVKRNVVLRALHRLPPGAHVVWLDQVLPMYRKDVFAQDAVIGMWKSTNHRFRGITIFRRLGSGALVASLDASTNVIRPRGQALRSGDPEIDKPPRRHGFPLSRE